MLSLLKIKNIALIDALQVEFGSGLNLLTGETGSGKSIIVDSLGALTGDRVSSDLIKEGEGSAEIQGLFAIADSKDLNALLDGSGIETDGGAEHEIIVRRELSAAGKNRVFVNNQLVTANFLKRLGAFLVDIHGQGEQTSLFNPQAHLAILDEFAKVETELEKTAAAFEKMSDIKSKLRQIDKDQADKLQLLDVLRFQVDEIKRVAPLANEDTELEEEKRRLNNAEKLSALSGETYELLYENAESTIATFEKAVRRVTELADFDAAFKEYLDHITSAQAVIEDLAITARDYRSRLEFSPERLDEIEDRLAEIQKLKRKYGGTIDAVLEHLKTSEERLNSIEYADLAYEELEKKLDLAHAEYLAEAEKLHAKREKAARAFEKETEANLKDVALEKARFEIKFAVDRTNDSTFTAQGFDDVEFYFSANVGESVKPLAKVASGGEASRLMLILKTVANGNYAAKSAVFDEIDTGIGGRVAEAVGFKLKALSKQQQVLCVTHQPQVAALADAHFVVEKSMDKNKTRVGIRQLSNDERVEEIARMLAGEKISETARMHAQEMLGAPQAGSAGKK